MQIFAHRGYSAIYPENTMIAFRKALEVGADGIELDARLTADGQIVVMHDATVNRTTIGDGVVRDMTFAEVTALDAGIKKGLVYENELVPSLEQVFKELGGKLLLNVELCNYTESDERTLSDAAGELVEKYHLEKSVIFSSFRFNNLVYIKDKHPEISCALLAKSGVKGLLARNLLNHSLSVDALHPHFSNVSCAMVRKEQQCGRQVRAWTVNESDELIRLYRLGVDAIFTDEPVEAIRLYNSERVLSESD